MLQHAAEASMCSYCEHPWTSSPVLDGSLLLSPFKKAVSEAENIGMRNDVDISYRLFLFPYRELVSDFVRARGVPYCNVRPAWSLQTSVFRQESILRIVQLLARHLQREGASTATKQIFKQL